MLYSLKDSVGDSFEAVDPRIMIGCTTRVIHKFELQLQRLQLYSVAWSSPGTAQFCVCLLDSKSSMCLAFVNDTRYKLTCSFIVVLSTIRLSLMSYGKHHHLGSSSCSIQRYL